MKRPDWVILLAIWEFLSSFGAFIGVIAIAVFAWPQSAWLQGIARTGMLFGLSIALLVLLTYMALSVAAGIGLVTGKEWGRILAIVHSAVSLLNIPIGTIIGIIALIYLTKEDVRQYFQSAPPGGPAT